MSKNSNTNSFGSNDDELGDKRKSFVHSNGRNGIAYTPSLRPDELTKPTEEQAVEAQQRAQDSLQRGLEYKRTQDPRVLKKKPRKTKLAVIGITHEAINLADKDYRNCVNQATAYKRARESELYILNGYVSTGVNALLATAALAMAGSRYLYEKVAKTNDHTLLGQAARLGDSARQNELAAWELCAREAITRKKIDSQNKGLPWLKTNDEGQEQRGPKPKNVPVLDIVDIPDTKDENA